RPLGTRKRRVEWIIERLVFRKIGPKGPIISDWVRVAKKKEFTTRGAVGYMSRLRRVFPESTYRIRHIETNEIIPSEAFGI
ncbi:MAG: hypothetical protein MN733_33930, partial [Nitrososphaera sp.]|nr:hypothetical protein [Nitrososphaera sp.]